MENAAKQAKVLRGLGSPLKTEGFAEGCIWICTVSGRRWELKGGKWSRLLGDRNGK